MSTEGLQGGHQGDVASTRGIGSLEGLARDGDCTREGDRSISPSM